MDTNQSPVRNGQRSETITPESPHFNRSPKPGTKRSLPRPSVLIGTVIVVAVLVGFIAWCFAAQHHSSQAFNENTNINAKEYQAIFLTNGQVYFGKLADLNHQYVTITDIYYLQVQQNLQNATTGANSSTNASKVSLAKLGNELHGPEDKMYIAQDQVLFWENLKNDSKVVQAITKYQHQ